MELDDRLRDALADDRRSLPAWPDAAVRVRAGMRRRIRRRRGVAGVVVAAAVLAALVVPPLVRAGIDGPGPTIMASEPVPSASASPVPSPSPAQCVTSALSASVTGGSGAHPVITLTNHGSGACSTPDLVELLTTASGTAQAVPVDQPGSAAVDPVVLPGRAVTTDVTASLSCPGGTPVRYDTLALSVDGGETSIPLPGLTLTTTCVVRLSAWHLLPIGH